MTVASGLEARLIAVEAARSGHGGDWVAMLNTLRTDGTYTTTVRRNTAGDSVGVDTAWHAGTGGMAGLRPLADPSTGLSGAAATRAQLDLLFTERAKWLFFDGHRQGDLRRLLRQYSQYYPSQADVYPSGPYQNSALLSYGSDVTVPIPNDEHLNPKFTGCFNRGA